MSGIDPKAKTTRVRPQYLPSEATTQRLNRSVRPAPTRTPVTAIADVLHLAEAVPIVRGRLNVPAEFTDDAILSSLKQIAVKTTDRDRWRAAFDCNLARYLSIRGRDLSDALQELVALMPSPRS
ncbi:MAG: hypothetical protein K0U74_01500 [Alphaproteobacteria bacterium]|nr:hypothetical protein [Alphaproteobacteria bacterium]